MRCECRFERVGKRGVYVLVFPETDKQADVQTWDRGDRQIYIQTKESSFLKQFPYHSSQSVGYHHPFNVKLADDISTGFIG
jgi:hypothetical protein